MSNSIFSKVVGLSKGENQRTEDVFTEIFNVFLNSQKEISWLLKIFGLDYLEIGKVTSSTQVHLGRLELHDSASKPDIVIENENRDSIIIIESKIDSPLDKAQLKKYSEHLDWGKHKDKKNKLLLFIAKNIIGEAIANRVNLGNDKTDRQNDSNVKSGYTTWSKVYQVLKSKDFNSNSETKLYLKEMLTFMEEMDMAQPTLKIEDIMALKHYKNAAIFLEKFKEVGDTHLKDYGDKNMQGKKPVYNPNWEYLQERYVTISDKLKHTVIGYCLDISEDLVPQVYIETKILELKDFPINDPPGWKSADWYETWGFCKTLPLSEYFNSEDQLNEIKLFLIDAFEEANKIVKEMCVYLTQKTDMTKENLFP